MTWSEWYEIKFHMPNKGSNPQKHTMETRYASVHASEWKWQVMILIMRYQTQEH